jgi:cytochrome P450
VLILLHVHVPNYPVSSFVPECTQALVHTYSLHRDPRYFSPFPDAFWPDRWLPASVRQYPAGASAQTDPVVLDPSTFIPFSTGPTSCAGKNLALMELRAVACFVLQRFDVNVANGPEPESWEETVRDFFVMKTGSLPVILTPRCRGLQPAGCEL